MENNENLWPDGSPMDAWFKEGSAVALSSLGRQVILTDHGIYNDGRIYTERIQQLIDETAASGGGVIVVPYGIYRTASIWLKQGVHLWIAAGGVLMGSDDIADYPIVETRIEGETCSYFPALVNADGIDGLCIGGPGTIDGNGMRSWRAFWQRRTWNPACTNKDEQRPRLLYLSNCRNVTICDLSLQNAHFWTTHLYRCDHVKYLNCRILSPERPVKAPSTDAIDIDVCTDVLIRGCTMSVNDDAVVLKGGKGPTADRLPENGANARILVEDCRFGFSHSCLTFGSESIDDRNIIMRRVQADGARCLLRFKLRPDTPQRYTHLLLEEAEGTVERFLAIRPWTQFYDLKGEPAPPPSIVSGITMRNCRIRCDMCFDVEPDASQYELEDFTFEDLDIEAVQEGTHVPNAHETRVRITKLTETLSFGGGEIL
ncbi:MAG: exopolygalacturonase [Butyrivibrio sp.]|nr:exopolygalacturonase [Butyrivibrio sp.]